MTFATLLKITNSIAAQHYWEGQARVSINLTNEKTPIRNIYVLYYLYLYIEKAHRLCLLPNPYYVLYIIKISLNKKNHIKASA